MGSGLLELSEELAEELDESGRVEELSIELSEELSTKLSEELSSEPEISDEESEIALELSLEIAEELLCDFFEEEPLFPTLQPLIDAKANISEAIKGAIIIFFINYPLVYYIIEFSIVKFYYKIHNFLKV